GISKKPLSAVGQEQTSLAYFAMSALALKADRQQTCWQTCSRCSVRAIAGHATAPPSRAMNSRPLMPHIGLPPAPAPPVYRMLSLPRSGQQALGLELKCSESRWGAAVLFCAATWMIAHTDARSAALRDCTRVFVRFGSKADVAPCLDHVRFTPESRHPICAF